MNIYFDVPAQATVQLPEIAGSFAEMQSTEQSVVLWELFDALEFRCKDAAKYQMQLKYIAGDIKNRNITRLIYTIETLAEFLKDESK